jgi:hypothetical protein
LSRFDDAEIGETDKPQPKSSFSTGCLAQGENSVPDQSCTDMTDHEHPEDIPLGERFRKAQYLARELSEHLRQAYLPKAGDLRTASKIYDANQVSDQQMLDRMQEVLEAEEFTASLYAKLREYLDSIRADMQPLLFGHEQSRPDTSSTPE